MLSDGQGLLERLGGVREEKKYENLKSKTKKIANEEIELFYILMPNYLSF